MNQTLKKFNSWLDIITTLFKMPFKEIKLFKMGI